MKPVRSGKVALGLPCWFCLPTPRKPAVEECSTGKFWANSLHSNTQSVFVSQWEVLCFLSMRQLILSQERSCSRACDCDQIFLCSKRTLISVQHCSEFIVFPLQRKFYFLRFVGESFRQSHCRVFRNWERCGLTLHRTDPPCSAQNVSFLALIQVYFGLFDIPFLRMKKLNRWKSNYETF